MDVAKEQPEENQLAIENLFSAALELPKNDRRRLIDASDISDSCKQAVRRLLRAHEQGSVWLNEDIFTDVESIASGFLDSLVDEEHDSPTLVPGTTIDDFQVVEEIGRGGMSIVYKARQLDPVDRFVALKIIRPHLLSPQSLRRFVREQQALGMVSHPNIATLYGVGTSPHGQPYAAMEFVDGVPIDVYCDMHRLSIDDRLQAFGQLCDALQHAHEHGVVHRDIKPNNVLALTDQRKTCVKLIDFGVAKMLESHAPDETCVTRFGQLVGSPRYMSPEQIGGHDTTAKTDVYAAGLVLFELVTGSAFCQSDDLLSISQSFAQDQIELASDRIERSISAGDRLARYRSTTDRALVRRVRRDIDWILRKALARRSSDRYGSIGELLDDVNRSIAGEPVSASRPTFAHRCRRFGRDHKWLFIGMFATASLLLELTAFSHWHNIKAQDSTPGLSNPSVSSTPPQQEIGPSD